MQGIVRTPEAAKYLGLAASTLEKLRLTRRGAKIRPDRNPGCWVSYRRP
jgi:hypothetical protein